MCICVCVSQFDQIEFCLYGPRRSIIVNYLFAFPFLSMEVVWFLAGQAFPHFSSQDINLIPRHQQSINFASET